MISEVELQAILDEADAEVSALLQRKMETHPGILLGHQVTATVITPKAIRAKHAGNTRPLALPEVAAPVEMKRGRRAANG